MITWASEGGNILGRKISKNKGPEAGQCLACLSGSVHVLFKEEQGGRCDWSRVIGSENGSRGGQRRSEEQQGPKDGGPYWPW